MPTYGRAGVYTSEQLVGPQPTPQASSPSVAGFLGEHWRGPVGVGNAILCNSWANFVQAFGGFNSTAIPVLANPYLPFAVYEFFANGGQSCWVSRIAASLTPGASAAVTFSDSQATPVNTLTLTAGRLGVSGSPGTWGNSLNASITNRGGAGSGRFDLTIYLGGSSLQNVVEQWTDLSMNTTDSRYALAIINNQIQGSNFVFATNLNDAAASPNNCPVAVANKPFLGGVDPADPSNADYISALTYQTTPTPPTAPFDLVPGVLNINLPGNFTVTVADQVITYAQTRPYTFAVLDPQSGQTPAAAVAYEQSLAPQSGYAALYYPWLNALDPSSPNLQTTRLLPPGGFVLGQMASTDAARGVWKAPAGLATILNNVVAAERYFAPADLDTLNLNFVDVIKTQPNGQTVIFGARTMNSATASLYVPIRRTLNYIESTLASLTAFAVFEPNNQVLWGQLAATASQFLDGLFAQGAFPGSTTNTSYFVTCDNTVNTQQTIQQGIVNMLVGVALQYPAEYINITISQYQSTGQAVTSIT